MVNALLECKAVSTLVNSAGFTALEIALSNNTESDILDALRLAEARDMENVANGTQPLACGLAPESCNPAFFFRRQEQSFAQAAAPPCCCDFHTFLVCIRQPQLAGNDGLTVTNEVRYVGAYTAAAYRPHLATNNTDIPFHLQENQC